MFARQKLTVTEERCFLFDSYRDVISRTVVQSRELELVRELVVRQLPAGRNVSMVMEEIIWILYQATTGEETYG